MIHDSIELHNTTDIREHESGGILMQRVPEEVRLQLNPNAQQKMLRPAGGEIRFVCGEDGARVTLSCPAGSSQVVPFFGAFRHGGPVVLGPEPVTIDMTMSERMRESIGALEEMAPAFSPHVCRLMMWGEPICLHAVEGSAVRPPERGEVPRLRYLSYGTSITHGSAASRPNLTYVAQTARRLAADLLNFGVGGSCHAEPALADHFARREDWDFATLALSVNMLGGGFTAEAFRERVTYMVHTVAGSNTRRPVVCVTLYPFSGDIGMVNGNWKSTPPVFRQILREAVSSCPHPNAHLVEGPDVLTDFGGLTSDLIHPADDGMINMGENLARHLRPLIADL